MKIYYQIVIWKFIHALNTVISELEIIGRTTVSLFISHEEDKKNTFTEEMWVNWKCTRPRADFCQCFRKTLVHHCFTVQPLS